MDRDLNHVLDIALSISQHLLGIFKDEEDRVEVPKIEVNDENVIDVFTAYILSLKHVFGIVSPEFRDVDLIDFVGLVNRLVFQYLLENGEVTE